MKRIQILIFSILVFVVPVLSQVYQAHPVVVRNSSGQLISNSPVSIKIEIFENSAYAQTIYSEVHQQTSNTDGVATINIGRGKPLHGNFSDVKNSKASLFLKSFIDLNDGISFMEMEASQKSELPYALFAGCVPLTSKSSGHIATEIKLLVKDFDGNEYTPVKIGVQTWLKENLRASHYSDGTAINGAFDYDNNPLNADEYGKLYTWSAAMRDALPNNNQKSGIQGACPTGYHIPSEKEWKTLVENVSARGAAGGRKLKMQGAKHWDLANGTNETGFSAVGAGFLQKEGASYGNLKKQCFLWSATQASPTAARIFMMYDSGIVMPNHSANKTSGRSVRCVKD